MEVEFLSDTRIKLIAETSEDKARLQRIKDSELMVIGSYGDGYFEFELPSRFSETF